jgi:hypothetical protein
MTAHVERLREELEAVRQASADGLLRPAEVVEFARTHKRSALHKQFIWDDTQAAHEYRLWQARQIIRITVTIEDGSPRYVSLVIDRGRGGGYRDIQDVARSPNLSEMLLADAIRELNRVRAKYGRLEELVAMWRELDKVSAKVARRKSRAGPRPRKAA